MHGPRVQSPPRSFLNSLGVLACIFLARQAATSCSLHFRLALGDAACLAGALCPAPAARRCHFTVLGVSRSRAKARRVFDVQRLYDTDIPSDPGDTIVVSRAGLVRMVFRKSGIS